MLEQPEDAQDGQDVVEGGHDGADAEDEFEAPGDIDDNAQHGDDDGDDGLIAQVLADGGPDLGFADHLEIILRQGFIENFHQVCRTSGPRSPRTS